MLSCVVGVSLVCVPRDGKMLPYPPTSSLYLLIDKIRLERKKGAAYLVTKWLKKSHGP